MSLPVWEEWIEIRKNLTQSEMETKSLPVWEEWIEISSVFAKLSTRSVSSRMGRVD